MRRYKETAGPAEATGERTITTTISDGAPDLEGDRIFVDGWETGDYMANPVVLVGHQHRDLPVAKTVWVGVVGDRLKARAQFPPPGVSSRADEVWGLLKSGILARTSVGFTPLAPPTPNPYGGLDFHRQRLEEWSFVSLPANPRAAVDRSEWVALLKWLGQAGHPAPPPGTWPCDAQGRPLGQGARGDEVVHLDVDALLGQTKGAAMTFPRGCSSWAHENFLLASQAKYRNPTEQAMHRRNLIEAQARTDAAMRLVEAEDEVSIDPQVFRQALREAIGPVVDAAVQARLARLRGRLD